MGGQPVYSGVPGRGFDPVPIGCDTNHVTTRLTATLTGGVDPRWTASCELHVDPFRFDRVAKNLVLYGEELFGDEYDENAEPVRRDPREPFKKIGDPDAQRR